jgi:hypothetical protein
MHGEKVNAVTRKQSHAGAAIEDGIQPSRTSIYPLIEFRV